MVISCQSSVVRTQRTRRPRPYGEVPPTTDDYYGGVTIYRTGHNGRGDLAPTVRCLRQLTTIMVVLQFIGQDTTDEETSPLR